MERREWHQVPDPSVAAALAALAPEPPVRPRFAATPVLWGGLGFAALASLFYILA